MKRRYLVLGFSFLLALAVAVPALGQATDPTATTSSVPKKVKKKVNRALKKAKKANKRSKRALNTANEALTVANQALEQGGEPGAPGSPGVQGPAGPANVSVGDVATVDSSVQDPEPPDNGVRVITVSDGFAWALTCSTQPDNPTSSLVVANLTPGQDPAGNGGGNDSHIDGGLQFMNAAGNTIGDQSNSFDMGESAVVATSFNPHPEKDSSPNDWIQRQGFPHVFPGANPDEIPDTDSDLGPLDWGFADTVEALTPFITGVAVMAPTPEPETFVPPDFDELDSGYFFTGDYPDAFSGGWVLIYGTAGDGTTQAGFGGILNNPNDGEIEGNPDCAGSLNLLAR